MSECSRDRNRGAVCGPWRVLAVALALLAGAASSADPAQRDPLRPPGYGQSVESSPAFDASAWQLSSTLVSDGRTVAIINGHSVRVGASIDGADVVSIQAGRVVLDYRGRRFSIRRHTASVRHREYRGDPTE